MRRRLAVILMADMVDYTAAMEQDQAAAVELIRELRQKWLEPEAVKRGGEVLKRLGDGWIFAFPSVTDAVDTAQSVQSELVNHERIRLRIAAHLGEIVEDDEDMYGAGINITARLQTEAPPGGVMISEDLRRQLDDRLANGFSDAGTFDLKNVAMPVTGFQWRPTKDQISSVDEVPIIAVEQVKAAPETRETLEAGADLQEQLVHNLSRRTGVRILAADESGDAEATYTLRCRLRTRGSEAKITSTLVRCSNGQVTWSRVFKGDQQELLELTDRASEQLSDALRLQINAFDGERLVNLPDDQLSPSELRTRAAMLFYRATVEDYLHAGQLLERALRLDPENASGLAMWCEAQLYVQEACYRNADSDLHARVTEASDKAVQNSPRSDYSWYIRAQIRARLNGDLHGARKDVERLAKLNPGYVLGMEALGYIEIIAGNWESASRSLTEAANRSVDDPFLPFRLYPLAVARMMAGQSESALSAITDATELRPSCRHFWLVKAWILKESGNKSEAVRAAESAEKASGKADVLAQNLRLPESVRKAIGLTQRTD